MMLRNALLALPIVVYFGTTNVLADGLPLSSAGDKLLQSAMKVVGGQVNATQTKLEATIASSSQAYSNVLVANFVARQTRSIVDDVYPSTPDGRASSTVGAPCYQMGESRNAAAVSAQTAASVQTEATVAYATSASTGAVKLRLIGPIAYQIGKSMTWVQDTAFRMAVHRERYCLPVEAEVGACQLQANGLQGADQDFTMLVDDTTFGREKSDAAAAFAATIAPTLPAAGRKGVAGPGGAALAAGYAAAHRRSEAAMSFARASLIGFVESHSTQKVNGPMGGR
jgi:hypothetical protein